ncbi:MAG TPA: hypothetical protein VJ997_13660 [Longimicrobiales bacterium]|nr:hypothetical protein [Longimicrobiales bacterium]
MHAPVRFVAPVLLPALLALPGVVAPPAVEGQVGGAAAAPLPALTWRTIGPNRGGRSIAAAGSSARPLEYYFGATGGGLWKTTDGGTTWSPVTDGKIGSSSVGAVAVAPSDPDVVWLGMGETQLRGNVMQGDGVYRTTDGGATWTHLGLDDSQAIGRIRVHPGDADVAWVAALGHPFGRNAERGVYRTRDGGRSWTRVLFRDEGTGAVDLALDPNDPDVVYATLWEVYRRPWKLWSGGPGSGLFKSTDGGDSWVELTRNPGLPTGVLGKMTVAVGADSRTVYANIEAEEGGLYRSDDAGATWHRVNGDRNLWQRSFYFLRVTADPVDPETVYVMSFQFEKSTDGGRTFRQVRTPHGDHHDLWIDPLDPQRMINANDSGANVTTNGGRTWTEQDYPTAQIYRVATSADFPYHVCGAQQDNTTVCVPSDGGGFASPGVGRPGDFFYAVGGGESATIAPDPRDPDVFYAGATNSLDRFDRRTGQARDVQPNPYLVMGEAAAVMPERWNWVYPLVFSPVEPDALYAGSQHLWRTRDQGRTWEKISPDLTRAEPETLGETGGPIILDQDGPEVYGTLYTIAPSRHEAATVWTGSDDGLVHVTRDGGATWTDVTPPDMAAHTRLGLIEASPHAPGGAYVAGRRYEMDDRAPYVWKTSDFGATWTKIVTGLPPGAFVHAVREDPVRRGLLYAGTEHGVWVSFDDGAAWQSLSLNLPDVAVTALTVTDRDVVIATHGRSFYVLDDAAPLRQWPPDDGEAAHVFTPEDAVRRVYPAHVDLLLRAPARAVTVEILKGDGTPVRTLVEEQPLDAGAHRLSWDLRYTGATVFENLILEGGDPSRGPLAAPGTYRVRVTVDGAAQTRRFDLLKDPRLVDVTDANLEEQLHLALRIRDATSAANEGVLRIRFLRAGIEARLAGTDNAGFKEAAGAVLADLAAVEGELYQVRNRSPKDKIAYPIKLNDRLTGLRSILESGDERPTAAQRRVFEELSGQLDVQLQELQRIVTEELPRLERLIADRDAHP